MEVAFVTGLIIVYLLTYRVLPNSEVPWAHVVPAAVMAALVIELGKFVYLLSLPLLGFGETYRLFALTVTPLFWAL